MNQSDQSTTILFLQIYQIWMIIKLINYSNYILMIRLWYTIIDNTEPSNKRTSNSSSLDPRKVNPLGSVHPVPPSRGAVEGSDHRIFHLWRSPKVQHGTTKTRCWGTQKDTNILQKGHIVHVFLSELNLSVHVFDERDTHISKAQVLCPESRSKDQAAHYHEILMSQLSGSRGSSPVSLLFDGHCGGVPKIQTQIPRSLVIRPDNSISDPCCIVISSHSIPMLV